MQLAQTTLVVLDSVYLQVTGNSVDAYIMALAFETPRTLPSNICIHILRATRHLQACIAHTHTFIPSLVLTHTHTEYAAAVQKNGGGMESSGMLMRYALTAVQYIVCIGLIVSRTDIASKCLSLYAHKVPLLVALAVALLTLMFCRYPQRRFPGEFLCPC